MSQQFPIHSLASAQAYENAILGDNLDKIASAMENAGRAIGAELLEDYKEIRPWPQDPAVLVLGGKGLNTGDALIACKHLQSSVSGLRVTFILTVGEESLKPIVKAALDDLKNTMGDHLQVVSVEAFLSAPATSFEVVIDGLYGHGFRPPLDEEVAGLLRSINAHERLSMRVSVDLPSGMGDATEADTFRADITYIPGVAKEPCLREENAGFVGRLRFLEIEPFLNPEPGQPGTPHIVSRSAYKARNRLRAAHTDKRDYGHCLILAGSSQMPGAALMATMGALNAGAGLVTTIAPSAVTSQIAGSVPEAMWHPYPINMEGGLDSETIRRVSTMASSADVLLIGPGLILSRSTVFSLCRIIREVHIPLVLDATALTQDIVAAVLGRPLSAGPVILTPHIGELARMNGQREKNLGNKSLMEFSLKHRVITVLKGSSTRITDGENFLIAPVGGPVLARGGTGDILAGMLTALLAQTPENPLEAAVDAVTWHGAAADSLARERGAIAVKATDLLPHLATSLRA